MPSAPEDSVGDKTPVVLIVDDEHTLLAMLRETLAGDYEVETASNAEEADLMMASRRYDAIVCDHMLPGEQGLDFLIRMSTRFPETRRILLTGYTNPIFLNRSMSLAKLSACVLKPAHGSELAAAVRDALLSKS